jgi:hypothetical protein
LSGSFPVASAMEVSPLTLFFLTPFLITVYRILYRELTSTRASFSHLALLPSRRTSKFNGRWVLTLRSKGRTTWWAHAPIFALRIGSTPHPRRVSSRFCVDIV